MVKKEWFLEDNMSIEIKLSKQNFTIKINNETHICPYDPESEDYWYSLKNYDVNIYKYEGVKKATVYPVKDGITDYNTELKTTLLWTIN